MNPQPTELTLPDGYWIKTDPQNPSFLAWGKGPKRFQDFATNFRPVPPGSKAAARRAFDAYDQPCGHGAVEWESMSDESRRVWGRVVQAVLKSGDAP